MEVLDDWILEPAERAFDAVGAMQGDFAPVKRAAIGAAIGYAFVNIVKPSVAFDDKGNAKPFKGNSTDPNATWFPDWMFIAIPAVVSGVFI